MINYEIDISPFFNANKKSCEAIESRINAFKYKCSGFCNSYGYEIETSFKRNDIDCNLKYLKYQKTSRGRLLPMNAVDYEGLELIIEGLDKSGKLHFGKNRIRRLFTAQNLKETVPSPFYVSTNFPEDKLSNARLFKVLLDHNVDSFQLKNGKAIIKIHSASLLIFELIDLISAVFPKITWSNINFVDER